MGTLEEDKLGWPAMILEGEAAKRFDEYDKKPLTERERELLKESDAIYLAMREKANE